MRRAGLLALASLLLLAPSAQAAHDPVGAGTTRLVLDPGFLALMKKNDVKLRAVAPAKLKKGAVAFPVSGGKLDPVSGFGTVEHDGALRLQAGNRSIPIRDLQLKTTQRHSPFSAKVGGSQLKLASAGSIALSRQGFGTRIEVRGLEISAKLATRLAKKLRLRGAIEAGQPLGSALSRAEPQSVRVLAQGRASLAFDPAFQAKLASLFVAVNPIFPVEHPGDFTLPIAGGQMAPDGSAGTLATGGSLEFLQQGGGQVFWAEAGLDLGGATFSAEAEVRPSPPYAGKVGRVAVAGFELQGARIVSQPSDRTVALEGGRLSLAAGTAATFNEVFAKPQGQDGVFVAGETVGSVSFAAKGQ
jgi:hypothetical protein